jgi:hypothetical protein
MVRSAFEGADRREARKLPGKAARRRRNCHFQVYDMWPAMQVLQSISLNFPDFVKIVATHAK